MNDFYIFDDFLTIEEQDYIENYLTVNTKICWKFLDDITYPTTHNKKRLITKYTPAIMLQIFNPSKNVLYQEVLDNVIKILFKSCKKINITPKEVLNVRSFISFPLIKSTPQKYNNPHVDLHTPHMVCLYYVNDTDGDTFFFDKTLKDVDMEKYKDTKFEVLNRVTPKKGRVVIFNGERYHASSDPTKNIRCIVNFDFTT